MKTRPYIDKIFVFVTEQGVQRLFDVMRPADNYDSMELEEDATKTFNITFPKVPINSKVQASFNLLAYGMGGEADYILPDLLSEPINPDTIAEMRSRDGMSNIVVNTPGQINAVILEFPKAIQDALDIPKWMYLGRLDTTKYKTNNKLTNQDLMARGVDPDHDCRNWVGQLHYQLKQWGRERPDDFTNHINSFLSRFIVSRDRLCAIYKCKIERLRSAMRLLTFDLQIDFRRKYSLHYRLIKLQCRRSPRTRHCS